ncbi:MAG: O-antigen ligase family protein [Eubacteriales bacterium]|jgi:putative inorganic carbon (HCO3(-)) transporter
MEKIVAFGNALWDKLIFYMSYSVLGRLILGCMAGVEHLLSGSLFVRAMASERLYDQAGKSLLGRWIAALFNAFRWIGRRLGRYMVARSVLVYYFRRMMRGLRHLTGREVACFLLPAGLGLLPGSLPLGLAVVILAGLMMLAPGSLYEEIRRSVILRFLFGWKVPESSPKTGNARLRVMVCAVLGICMAAAELLLGPMTAMLLAAALVGGVAMVTRPEVGVFACVFLAPFLPTMVLAGILGLTLCCFVLQLLAGSRRYTFKMDTTGLFMVAFGAMLLFFGVTSFQPASSIKIALLECLFLCAYFLILFLVDNRAKLKGMVFTYCVSALLTGFVGLYQYLSGHVDTTWTDTELFEELSFRVYSTFENPNVYGEYLLLCLPMAVVMACISRRPVAKLFYAGTSAVLLVNLALTYSRGCYLAILLAVLVVIWFGARRLLALGFVGLFALPFVLPASIINRFASILNFEDSSTSYRLNIWQGTVRMLEDFWPFGVGLGQDAYNSVYPIYGLNNIFAPHAHSLYLQVLSEMGIAGFTVMSCMFLAFFSAAYVAMRKAKGSRTMWFVIAMMAAVLAFLFEGIFEYIWYNYRVFLLFFITMGIVSALCRRVIKEGELTFD